MRWRVIDGVHNVAQLSAVIFSVAVVSSNLSATKLLHNPTDQKRQTPETPGKQPTLTPGTPKAERFRSYGFNATATTTDANGNSSTTVKDIWLIGLFPLQGSWPGGLGQLPAVQMGIEDVNADPNILFGYRLRMTMDDTEVSHCDNSIYICNIK